MLQAPGVIVMKGERGGEKKRGKGSGGEGKGEGRRREGKGGEGKWST